MISIELQSCDVKDNYAEIPDLGRFKQMMELIRLIILFWLNILVLRNPENIHMVTSTFATDYA